MAKKTPQYQQAAYTLQKISGTEIMPVQEVLRAFMSVLDILEKVGANESPQGKILSGIAETLHIKIEGMHEAVKEYREESAVLSRALSREKENAAAFLEKARAAALAFKKNVLLSEAATFEEILTHSVPRLRDSGDTAAKNAAEALTQAFEKLEIILKKNGVETLRPAPHTMFNAKEHEVIIAEKQEGFAKGEIIKVIGAGYRVGGEVLLRADVIAAR